MFIWFLSHIVLGDEWKKEKVEARKAQTFCQREISPLSTAIYKTRANFMSLRSLPFCHVWLKMLWALQSYASFWEGRGRSWYWKHCGNAQLSIWVSALWMVPPLTWPSGQCGRGHLQLWNAAQLQPWQTEHPSGAKGPEISSEAENSFQGSDQNWSIS